MFHQVTQVLIIVSVVVLCITAQQVVPISYRPDDRRPQDYNPGYASGDVQHQQQNIGEHSGQDYQKPYPQHNSYDYRDYQKPQDYNYASPLYLQNKEPSHHQSYDNDYHKPSYQRQSYDEYLPAYLKPYYQNYEKQHHYSNQQNYNQSYYNANQYRAGYPQHYDYQHPASHQTHHEAPANSAYLRDHAFASPPSTPYYDHAYANPPSTPYYGHAYGQYNRSYEYEYEYERYYKLDTCEYRFILDMVQCHEHHTRQSSSGSYSQSQTDVHRRQRREAPADNSTGDNNNNNNTTTSTTHNNNDTPATRRNSHIKSGFNLPNPGYPHSAYTPNNNPQHPSYQHSAYIPKHNPVHPSYPQKSYYPHNVVSQAGQRQYQASQEYKSAFEDRRYNNVHQDYHNRYHKYPDYVKRAAPAFYPGFGRPFFAPGLDTQWFSRFYSSFRAGRVSTNKQTQSRLYYRYGDYNSAANDFRKLQLEHIVSVQATATQTEVRSNLSGLSPLFNYRVYLLSGGCAAEGYPGAHPCIVFKGPTQPYSEVSRAFIYIRKSNASFREQSRQRLRTTGTYRA